MSAESRNRRILYVEDDNDLSQVMSMMAGHESIDFICAASLAEARSCLESETFDLVIIDPGLPDGNGIVLLDDLETPRLADIPVVIYSSDSVDARTTKRVQKVFLKSRDSGERLLKTIAQLT